MVTKDFNVAYWGWMLMKGSRVISVVYVVSMVLVLLPLLVVLGAPSLPVSILHLFVMVTWLPFGLGIHCAMKNTSLKLGSPERGGPGGSIGAIGFGLLSSLIIFLLFSMQFILMQSLTLPIAYSFDVVSVGCWASAAIVAFTTAMVSFLLDNP
jgi:hypothetical protein